MDEDTTANEILYMMDELIGEKEMKSLKDVIQIQKTEESYTNMEYSSSDENNESESEKHNDRFYTEKSLSEESLQIIESLDITNEQKEETKRIVLQFSDDLSLQPSYMTQSLICDVIDDLMNNVTYDKNIFKPLITNIVHEILNIVIE